LDAAVIGRLEEILPIRAVEWKKISASNVLMGVISKNDRGADVPYELVHGHFAGPTVGR
jgi:hypothetical protein